MDSAYEALVRTEHGRRSWREGAATIGGVIAGAAISLFATELTKPNHADINPVLVAIYASFSLAGLIAITLGFAR